MSIFADEVSMRSNTPSVADLVSATISLWAPLSYSRSTISMIDVVGSSAPAPIGAYVIAVFKHLGSARHSLSPSDMVRNAVSKQTALRLNIVAAPCLTKRRRLGRGQQSQSPSRQT